MSKGKKYQEGYAQGYEDAVKTEMVYKEKEKQELLLGLVPVANKGQELIPHKDYEIKQDGEKFYLVKKKKEYPKTYEVCLKVLGFNVIHKVKESPIFDYDNDIVALQRLKRCRDAYWKIAGEEMGLGKPWEPDWKNSEEKRYSIVNFEGDIKLPEKTLTKWILKVTNKILVFPTEEMRDAFYENFEEIIEICKELL